MVLEIIAFEGKLQREPQFVVVLPSHGEASKAPYRLHSNFYEMNIWRMDTWMSQKVSKWLVSGL